MAVLFEPSKINRMELRNRFVRSATWEGLAEADGSVTPKLTDLLVRLARGEVGLIITGHAYVAPAGQAGPWQLGIYADHLVNGLRDLAAAVHAAGGRIAVQLAHAGCFAATKLSGTEAISPSGRVDDRLPECRQMSREEIEATIAAFAAAAGRAKEAGYDAVQLHAAHGYLLSQFLSPVFNRRQDEFGGDIAGRSRMLMEVYRAVRRQVGEEFPVLVKINSEDFIAGGFTVTEMLEVAAMLEAEGVDALELSGGTGISDKKMMPVRVGDPGSEADEVYYLQAARRFKQARQVPLILVGGIRSYQVAETLATREGVDYISMSRPLIREPELVKRWRTGDTSRAACVSDNLCFRPAMRGDGIYCVTAKRQQNKARTE